MAAFSVEQNVRYVVESVGVGIGGGIFLLGGMFLGEKDYHMLKSCCKVSLRYIIVGVGALSIVYFLAAPFIAGIYVPVNAPSYDWSVSILRCHAVSLPFLAYNEFYQNLVQAQKKYMLNRIVSAHNDGLTSSFIQTVTVGPGVAPGQPCGSRTLPPIGNFTLP